MEKLSSHSARDFGLGEYSVSAAANGGFPWIEWDETRAFDKPTLLILGGNKTKSPKEANGYIKLFQKLLPLEELPKIQIVSVYYQVPDRSLPLYMVPKLIENKTFDFHNKKLDRFEGTDIFKIAPPAFPYAERLYQTHIEPMLVDSNTRKRLPKERALKNMRNLNIATHSFGDYFAIKLSEVMYEKMQVLGYAPKEAADIMKQVAVLTLGGPTVLGEKNRFTTLNVFSTRDAISSFFQSSAAWNKYLSDLFREKSDNQGMYLSFSNNEAALVLNRFYKSSFKPNEGAEHGNVFFETDTKKMTRGAANAKILYRNFLANALAHSIQNADSDTFRPLPAFTDLLRAAKNSAAGIDGLAQLEAALFLENAVKSGRFEYNNRLKLLRPHQETKFPLSPALIKKLDSIKR